MCVHLQGGKKVDELLGADADKLRSIVEKHRYHYALVIPGDLREESDVTRFRYSWCSELYETFTD